MPKGKGRPFNKTERQLSKSFKEGKQKYSSGTSNNKARERNRENRDSINKVLAKTGILPYVRTGVTKETQVTPGKWETKDNK